MVNLSRSSELLSAFDLVIWYLEVTADCTLMPRNPQVGKLT
jgi:hypothetical protein